MPLAVPNVAGVRGVRKVKKVAPVSGVKPVKPVSPVSPVAPVSASVAAPPSDVETVSGVTSAFPSPIPVMGEVTGISANPNEPDPVEDPVPLDEDVPLEHDPDQEFISARAPQSRVVYYVRANGTKRVRRDGSRSWRNNNPGNIRESSFATNAGAIGDDGSFAIFPDRQTGENAIVALLTGNSYVHLTVAQAMNRYAPPSENDTNGYIAFVTNETDIAADAVLSGLSSSQIRAMAKAITRMEGWKAGRQYEFDMPEADMGDAVPAPSAGQVAHEWMAIAEREAALPFAERSEWSDAAPVGQRENPRILRYFQSCDLMGSNWGPGLSDETDWCAAFVNYCLEEAGYAGTDHPGARSFFWNRGNRFVSLAKPALGAIAVFRDSTSFGDPDWEYGSGHVGFIVGWTETRLALLGGNQGETVQVRDYPVQTISVNGHIKRRLERVMMPRIN